jgi:probable F420-dependent oxidoreductase
VDLGAVGLWTSVFRSLDPSALADIVGEVESLGFRTLWFPGGPIDGAFEQAGRLLQSSERVVVATGIVSVWAGDAPTVAAAHRVLRADHPGRFLLGLGISHRELVDSQEPGRYRAPLQTMKRFLDDLDAADPDGNREERALAALGPKMLKLAATDSAGAHPYFVPVEHTAFARDTMGPDALLAPEQAVVLERDPSRAREIARSHMQLYLLLANYVNNLRLMGFTEEDVSGGGSDRLVDAIVAWGDTDHIALRVRDHHAAGADHVCLQVITDDPRTPPVAQWRELAGALL